MYFYLFSRSHHCFLGYEEVFLVTFANVGSGLPTVLITETLFEKAVLKAFYVKKIQKLPEQCNEFSQLWISSLWSRPTQSTFKSKIWLDGLF